jgi:hypothetical protein
LNVLREVGSIFSLDLDDLGSAGELLIGIRELDINIAIRAGIVGVEFNNHIYLQLWGWIGVVEDTRIERTAIIAQAQPDNQQKAYYPH